MARMEDLHDDQRRTLEGLPLPEFDTNPFVEGSPLDQRRVAIVTTAGLHRRGDRPFAFGSRDYRVIAGDTPPSELVMSHVSSNFDRTGYQADPNVVFPLELLRALAAAGEIGSVADHHYSFMGATPPERMEADARALADLLAADGVDAVLLVPI